MKTRIMVALTLLGKGINPNEITRKLNLRPSEIGREGDLIGKTKIKQKYDFWSLSNGYQESLDLGEQIKLFLDKISPYVDRIKTVALKRNLKVEIECAVDVADYEFPAICLENDTLQIVASLNADINIDIV